MAHVNTVLERFQIFKTLCVVKGKSCILFIDSGSARNFVSRYLVDKLQLPIQPHPHPHYSRGLTDNDRQHVTSQCKVHFSIDNYQDTVLFEVVDMDFFHLVLGRPWLFDVDATHRGKANTYTFVKDGLKFVLLPTLIREIWPIEMPQWASSSHQVDPTGIWPIVMPPWPSRSHQVDSTPTTDTQSSPPLIPNYHSIPRNWSPPLSGRNEEENFSDSRPFSMEGDFASSDPLIQRENIFPERLGQRECDFYMKTGDCKFGTRCKFHHPKERSILAPCPREITIHDPCQFDLLGRCRFGTTCRYDHPCS